MGEEPNNSQMEKSTDVNPVFRELAVINGKINRMSNDELRRKCVQQIWKIWIIHIS